MGYAICLLVGVVVGYAFCALMVTVRDDVRQVSIGSMEAVVDHNTQLQWDLAKAQAQIAELQARATGNSAEVAVCPEMAVVA